MSIMLVLPYFFIYIVMTEIVNNIYDVFKDFFGEDNVDLQSEGSVSSCIYVYWNNVQVTNELDRFVIIHGLYSRVKISFTGRLIQDSLSFIRDSYTETQWNGRYIHSHIQSPYGTDSFFSWHDRPCLGSGPIKRTIAKLGGGILIGENYLNEELYKDMDVWRLFCFELDKYVHIESLAGGPYYRLESISSDKEQVIKNYAYKSKLLPNQECIIPFFDYLAKSKVLKFNYLNNNYCLGDSFENALISISNVFIDWYNKYGYNIIDITKLKENNIIFRAKLREGKIYSINNSNSSHYHISDLSDNIGRKLPFTFKGNDVVMHKIKEKDKEENNNDYILLNTTIFGYITYKILRYLNCEYGKSNNSSLGTNSTEEINAVKKITKVL